MAEYTDGWRIYNDLTSLLQSKEEMRKENKSKDRYREAVEAFLSYMQETPKTMLDKVREAKTLRTREGLREHIVRESIGYLDDLAERDEISVREYSFRSAVIGDFIKLLGSHVVKET